jgi:multidrug efflux pump subunit AcrA (membrane-fusion protein)
MLEISDNKVSVDTDRYGSFKEIELTHAHKLFRNWAAVVLVIVAVTMFLPWTQNVRAKGFVTTLTPDQRPQNIHSVIAGQIDKWYVMEGQMVKKGDTIVKLTEVKTEYFDPLLIPRTQGLVTTKQSAVVTYNQKAAALDRQIVQFRGELSAKKDQLFNKIEQTKLKAEANRNKQIAAEKDYINETVQLGRMEEMFREGITPLSTLENKRIKLQQAQAKQVEAQNDYQQTIQELQNLKFQLSGIENEYQGKIAKAESDRLSTVSDRLGAEGDVFKLSNQLANYEARSRFYYIVAPQDCYIAQAAKMGIGETVKEGDVIVSIVPSLLDLAVEIFIKPIDLPLFKLDREVRFIFDGWPAFVFSGWPNASVGTYSGIVAAIDNVANEKGLFRVLVSPHPDKHPWPQPLRPGGGAQSFALFENVPVWYEIWRQLNGFPPEYYSEPVETSGLKIPKIKIGK